MIDLLYLWRRRYWRFDRQAHQRLPSGQPATVVTGASDGLGRSLAKSFAKDGNRLVLIARHEAGLLDTAREIAALGAPEPIILPLDITRPEAVERIAARLETEGLYIDVLINCAGIGQAGAFASAPPDRLDAMIALNITALSQLMRHALPDMLVRGRGGVLNIGSLGGMVPGPNQAAYYASKAYVILLTKAVAQECKGKGVRVSVAAPGPIETKFHERMGAKRSVYHQMGLTLRPETAARDIRYGYWLGLTVIVPGILPFLLWPFARFTPHWITAPLMKVLLGTRVKQEEHKA